MRERFPVGFWLLTLLARVLGASKEMLLAMTLGTSLWKDALVAAWTAPALIASYGNETLPALLTPRWAQAAPGQAAGVGGLVAAAAALQVGLSLAALAWPRVLIAGVAPGLHGPAASAAIELERWLALNIALLGAQTLLGARLNARRRFAWAPAGVGLSAATVIATLALTRGWALARRIVWIAAAMTVGNGLAAAAMLGAVLLRPRRSRVPLAPAGDPKAWGALGTLLLAMLVLNLVPLSERMAASGLAPGSLAAFDYGERLVQWIFSLSVGPLTAVSFTRMAEQAGTRRGGGGSGYARQFEGGLATLLTVALPLAAGCAMFPRLLTRCVFGWGRFNAASLAATVPVVAIKGAGLGLDAAFYYLMFAIYAHGQARAKLPIALALAGVNVPLAFWGASHWGLAGLAGAHVVSYAAALAWIWARRRRYLPPVRWRGALASGAKAGAVTLAAAGGVRALMPAAAAAGRLGGAASWGWALAALAATAIITAGLARWLAPELGRELRQALWPKPAAMAKAA